MFPDRVFLEQIISALLAVLIIYFGMQLSESLTSLPEPVMRPIVLQKDEDIEDVEAEDREAQLEATLAHVLEEHRTAVEEYEEQLEMLQSDLEAERRERKTLEAQIESCREHVAALESKLDSLVASSETGLEQERKEGNEAVSSAPWQVEEVAEEPIEDDREGSRVVEESEASTTITEETPLQRFLREIGELGLDDTDAQESTPKTEDKLRQIEPAPAAIPSYRIVAEETVEPWDFCKVSIDVVVSGKVTRAGLALLLEDLCLHYGQATVCQKHDAPTQVIVSAYPSSDRAMLGNMHSMGYAVLNRDDAKPYVDISYYPEDWAPFEIDWGQ